MAKRIGTAGPNKVKEVRNGGIRGVKGLEPVNMKTGPIPVRTVRIHGVNARDEMVRMESVRIPPSQARHLFRPREGVEMKTVRGHGANVRDATIRPESGRILPSQARHLSRPMWGVGMKTVRTALAIPLRRGGNVRIAPIRLGFPDFPPIPQKEIFPDPVIPPAT